MTRYLLDANIFIQAKNLHYGFDFCPAFWEWLETQNDTGKVVSVEEVGRELRAGTDELASWAKARGAAFFLRPDSKVLTDMGRVSTWANNKSYVTAAISTFLGVADCWIVAHALAHNYIVVTHEIPTNSIKKIKVPDACKELSVRCISPYEMLRKENARFVLGA